MTTTKPKTYRAFLPIAMNSHTPPRPLKAGLAASSHEHLAERVELLGGVVGVRGWKLGTGGIPVRVGGADYVPCYWCDLSAEVRNGKAAVQSQLHVPKLAAARGEPLLFLNEPDMSLYGHFGQCDISPNRAAVLYLDVVERFPDLALVGPGISHLDYLHGFQWLGQWIDGVQRLSGKLPHMAAWDIHNYLIDRPALAPIDALQAFLLSKGIVANRFYVSEWGVQTPEQMTAVRRAFDGDPRVDRHFYYDQYMAVWDGPTRHSLFVEGSNPLRLSPLGEAWVAAGR